MSNSLVFAGLAASLDGYIGAKDGDLSWLNNAMSPDEDYGFAETMNRTGAYILGAKTYQDTLQAAQGDSQDGQPTFVVTHRTDLPTTGKHVQFYSGDLSELVKRAKAATDKDVWVFGGGDLITQFIEHDLLDELNVSIVPVLLGGGVPLFGRMGGPKRLRLVDSKAFKSGLLSLSYRLEPEAERPN